MIHKPSLEPLDVPQKIWARSVQPLRRLLYTNKQTDRQTDKPNLYIDVTQYILYTLILVRKVKIEEPRGSEVVPGKAQKLDIFLSVWWR